MFEQSKSSPIRRGICPSCSQDTTFQLIGVQDVSPEIAQKLNVPTRYSIYRCKACDSSINEFAIDDGSTTDS